jgi:hypothetical protein
MVPTPDSTVGTAQQGVAALKCRLSAWICGNLSFVCEISQTLTVSTKSSARNKARQLCPLSGCEKQLSISWA